ncbi:MAG: NRDE family protein [Leptospira sp.]|nr:NRDE family protein [Leptospira sp.]
MCLAVLALAAHPDFPLILCSNRDEFFERPALPIHFWKDQPEIFGGIDLKANGTWLACTREGRLAFLTNVRNLKKPPHPNPRSRGLLVSEFLMDKGSLEDYANQVLERSGEYEGFNLLLYERGRTIYLGNDPKSKMEVEPGIHAVSNASWNTDWPKTTRAKRAVEEQILTGNFGKEEFFKIFADATREDDPDKLPDTGIGKEKERILSSIRIQTPGYGTRGTTITWISKNQLTMVERIYPDPMVDLYSERTLVCPMEPNWSV